MSVDPDVLLRAQRALDHRPEQGLAILSKSDLRKLLDALQAKELS